MIKLIQIVATFLFIATFTACGTTLIIEDVDFSQPLESVLTPDSNQSVHDQRYALRFNLSDLFIQEEVSGVPHIRMIRDRSGFYYITAPGFTAVYRFIAEESSFKLAERIEIPGAALQEPALNQRGTHIELVDTANGRAFNLSEL